MSISPATPATQPPTNPFTFPPTLQTARLTLSIFSPTRSSDIAYATSLFPSLDTLESFLEYCAQRAPAPWADSAIVYLLRLQYRGGIKNNDDKVIGHVSLAHSLESRQPRVLSPSAYSSSTLSTTIVPDIGWRLRPAHERQGYATEAVRRFLSYLCEEDKGPRFEVLSVFTGKHNVRSLGLAARAGFVCACGDDEDGDEGREDRDGDGDGDEYGGGYNEEEGKEGFNRILGCERVMKGIWFGVRPAGWRWEEGRKDRELRRCIEKLFE